MREHFAEDLETVIDDAIECSNGGVCETCSLNTLCQNTSLTDKDLGAVADFLLALRDGSNPGRKK